MANAGNVAKSLPYSDFQRLSTEGSTISSKTSATLCLVRQQATALHCVVLGAISVSRELRKQHASNFKNVSDVSLSSINSSRTDLRTDESQGKCLYLYIIQLDLCLFYQIFWQRQKRSNKCSWYGPSSSKNNRFVVKDYFNKLK